MNGQERTFVRLFHKKKSKKPEVETLQVKAQFDDSKHFADSLLTEIENE